MISKENAEHYTWGAHCDAWHLVKTPGLSVIHERMPPDAAEVRHAHNAARQFFFVLSGTVTLEVGGRIEALGPQQGLEIAPGEPHQMRNESNEPIEFLVISQPPSHGDRVLVPHDQPA